MVGNVGNRQPKLTKLKYGLILVMVMNLKYKGWIGASLDANLEIDGKLGC